MNDPEATPRLPLSNGGLPRIETARLVLTHAAPGMEARTVAFFERNREHFRPSDPPVAEEFYSREFWSGALVRAVDEFAADRAVRFDMTLAGKEGGPLVGRVSFSQIYRGPLQSCVLGYQIDQIYQGRGLMFEALTAAIQYMFRERNLHRISAGYLPENQRSARVLARLGFEVEGLARNFLYISDRWRDHVLTALVNKEFDIDAAGGLVRQG